MPTQNGGPSDELKLQALREAEGKSQVPNAIQPGRKRPTKYVAPGITKDQLQSLAPYYVDLGPKPPFPLPKRYKWYWTKHKERKKLRKQLRQDFGIKKRSDFETVAREVGLGIDNPILAWFWWFFSWLLGAGGLASVLGAATLLLSAFYVYSYITEQVGSFTIQLNPGTMESSFVLSNNSTFESVTGRLTSDEMDKVNAISIADVDRDVDNGKEGSHNGEHNIAYTFYIKNTSDQVQSYEYVLKMTDSIFGTEKAVWVMLFEDGKQIIYAAPKDFGASDPEPDRLCGYSRPPFFDSAYDPENQYYFYCRDLDMTIPDSGKSEDEKTDEEKFNEKYHIVLDDDGNRIKFVSDADGNIRIVSGNLSDERKAEVLEQANGRNWVKIWGINPTPMISENEVMRGIVEDIQPGEVHCYTVAIWLEGDDPDCNDELFGGYAKYMMEFYPTSEENKGLFSNIYRTEYDLKP